MAQDTKTAGNKAAGQPSRSDPEAKPRLAKAQAARLQGKDRDMGSALRSVYQKTVDEAVPDDLLDLLGKLG